MQLSSWTSERVVESLMYSKRRRSGQIATTSASRAAEAQAPYGVSDEQLRRQEAQDAYNAMCDRAALLIVTDLDAGMQIEDAIDAVFDDEDWAESMRTVHRFEEARPLSERSYAPDALEDRFPWALNPHLSPGTRQLARRCVSLMNEVYAAHEQLNAADQKIQPSVSRERQLEDHLWFLSDPAIAPGLRRAMLAYRRGSIALVATYPIMAVPTGYLPAQRHFSYVLKLLGVLASNFESYLGVLANYSKSGITLVKPDGSDVTTQTIDPIAPFREVVRLAGDTGVTERG